MHAKSQFLKKTAIAFATLIALVFSTFQLLPTSQAEAKSIGDSCGAMDGQYHGWIVAVSPDVCEWDPQGNIFVVPAGVTSIDVLAVGGGGGGGGRPFIDNTNYLENPIYSGGGGAGEVKICTSISVTPAESLSVTDGALGTRGNTWNFAGYAPYDLGVDGGDGGASSLVRASTPLCAAEGGKGGRGGNLPNETRGWGGDSGSGKIGGHAAFASTNHYPQFPYASSGGAGAASDGIAATFDGDVYTAGSGGHGISPSTQTALEAGYFSNDTNIYGVGGPGGGLDPSTGQAAWGANVDGQIEGYINTPGSGGRGYGAYSGLSMTGERGVIKIRFLNPASTNDITVATAGTGAGSVSTGTSTVNAGSTFTSTATANAGSVFAGWTCTPNSYSTVNATLSFTASENVSCTATFNTAPAHTITFTTGDGTGTPPPSANTPAVMPGIGNMIAPPGTELSGWVCTPDGGSAGGVTVGTSYDPGVDATCVAVWAPVSEPSTGPITPPHFVKFMPNGGDGTPYEIGSNRPGNLRANPFTRDGYDFSGWNTQANGSGDAYADRAPYNYEADVTLYAQWSANASLQVHVVSFKANGATQKGFKLRSNRPTALSANWFTKAGYVFTGWNTKADGSGVAYADRAIYDFDSDLTLYAQWSMVKAKKLITTFAGDKPTLTAIMKSEITKWIKKLPSGAEIICQGSTSGKKITKFDKWLADKRASNVCSYARVQRRDISFKITLNPSSATKVAARHVWMFYNQN